MWLMVGGWGRAQLLRLDMIIRHGKAGEGCLEVKWMLVFNHLFPKVGEVGVELILRISPLASGQRHVT